MCDDGWGGIDCNTRIEPCGKRGWGVPNVLDKMSGWVADGYEVYAENLNCTWVIRPEKELARLPSAVVFDVIKLENAFDWLYTYDSNFVDPSTQIAGFSNVYPYRVYDNVFKLPEVSNSSGGSGLTLQLQTDSSNIITRRAEIGSASKNESSAALFKGFRGFHFTPMDARNVLAVKDMVKVAGTTDAEYDEKFKTFDAASKMVAGAAHQEVFTCPVALLPFNITQKKPGGALGEMETLTVLRQQPLIDLDVSTPARPSQLAALLLANSSARQVNGSTTPIVQFSFSVMEETREGLGVSYYNLISVTSEGALATPVTINVTTSRCVLELYTQVSTVFLTKFYWNMKGLAFIGLTPTNSLHPLTLTPLNTTVMPSGRIFRGNQLFSSKMFPFLPAAASPKTSYARGYGLDPNNAGVAGVPSNFTVFSVDEYGNPRLNGGDLWTAVLGQHCKHYPSAASLYAQFSNLQNGTYYVEFTPTVSGRYWLSIVISNDDAAGSDVKPIVHFMSSPMNIKGSPFSILILSGQVSVANCSIIGNTFNAVSGFSSFFLVMVQDVFGNYASGKDTILMDGRLSSVQYDDANIPGRSQSPSRPSAGNVSFAGSETLRGSYLCEWSPLATGVYQISVLIRVSNHPSTPGTMQHITGSPFYLQSYSAPSYTPNNEATGASDGDVFGVRSFVVADKDWFGNVRKESASNVYRARLSGIQLSNCPYAEEKTLRDVLCKCPGLYAGSMNNCSYGGTTKSANMDKTLRARYMRGDVTGFRGAPGDDISKASGLADGRECFRAWLTNIMTSYRALDGFDCIGFPRIAMKAGVYPTALKSIFELAASRPEADNRAAVSRNLPVESTNQRSGTYFSVYSVTNAGVYSLSITDALGSHIRHSPFSILISPGALSAKQSVVKFINEAPFQGSPPGIEAGVGSRYSMSIMLRDSFSNFLWDSSAAPSVFMDDGYNCGSVEQCFPVSEVEAQRTSTTFEYFNLVDYADATYLASYILPKSGRFPMNIKMSSEHLAGSPYFVYVYAGDVSLSSTAVTGLGISSCGAGLSCTFSVITKDSFGNLRSLNPAKGQFNYTVEIIQSNPEPGMAPAYFMTYDNPLHSAAVPPSDDDCSYALKRTKPDYEAAYSVAVAGQYRISVTLLGEHVLGSPFSMSVFGGLTVVTNSLITGRGHITHHLGSLLTFSLFTRDKFFNFRTSGGEDVQVFVMPRASPGMSGLPSVVDKGTGEYLVSVQYVNYESAVRVDADLTIIVNGLAVPGSPLAITSGDGFDFSGGFCIDPKCGGEIGDAESFVFVGNAFPFQDSNTGDVLRITDSLPDQNGAVWFKHKQQMAIGWSLEFTFRLWDRSKPCEVCQPAGAEGFAFVLQNSAMGRQALGQGSSGLGYKGIENSVAIEFDTW